MSYRETSPSRHYFVDNGYVDMSEILEMWRRENSFGHLSWYVRYRGAAGVESAFTDKAGKALFDAFRAYRMTPL